MAMRNSFQPGVLEGVVAELSKIAVVSLFGPYFKNSNLGIENRSEVGDLYLDCFQWDGE